jgi:diguanylate cyclase (GGDEF)-like protein
MRDWLAAVERRLPANSGDARFSQFATPGVRTRVLGWVYLAGATLALGSMALPQPAGENYAGIYSTIAASYVIAGLLLWRADSLPEWGLQVGLAAGTGLVTAGIWFTAQEQSVYAMFYIWIGLVAVYFLPPRAAFAQIAIVAGAYAVLMAAQAPEGAAERWMITSGTVFVAGMFAGVLQRRNKRLVDELTEANRGLAEVARTDALTSLLNRRGFQEVFDLEIERARRGGTPLTLLVCDLDHFKRVNDRFGQQVGDRALEQLSAELLRTKRRIDTAARTGGEEFALLLPQTDEHGAYILAERMRVAIREAFADQGLALTISFGVATFPRHGEDQDVLLRAADQALYGAKELGRDRTVIHSPEIADMMSHAALRDSGESEIHLATVLTLAEALDIRDSGDAQHSQTVAHYAELIAIALDFDPAHAERLRLAGLLHDVGKVGVPDSILQKAGPLNEGEWEEVRQHPQIGARLLGGSLSEIGNWIRSHHERPDGKG